MTLRGIDVSRWQGAIAWLTVAPLIDFAYIKAGGGDDLSPYYDSFAHGNAIGAARANVPHGFYWFFSGRNTAQSQAVLIAQFHAAHPSALPWVIDIEDKTRGAGDIIDGLFLAERVHEITGVAPLIYTGAWWWDPKWALARTMGAPEVVPFRLWTAAYTPEPIIPKGWADYTVWQYSDRGAVAGITGNVDINRARAKFWQAPAQEVTVTRGQPRIDYGRVVHVLPSDASAAAMKTVMDAGYGRRETVGFSYDDAGVGDLSSRRAVLWDIPAAKQAEFVAFYGQYYPGVVVEFRQTAPVVVIPPVDPPPPAVTGKTRLGVNVVTGNGDVARRAIAAGCNAVSIINGFQLASELATNPNVTVMARRYVSGTLPAPSMGLYEGAESPHVVYLTVMNECDLICYGSVEEIARRAAWDREMWRQMKAAGRHYAGGGFSVGTPDYTKPEICEAMKTHYAPLYNDGMAINYHLYSPWPNHPMDQWYELRWRFLFERCGFDPNPALAGIYCDETGMDQGSVGGFPAVGFSAQQVGAWCRQFLDASQGGGYGNMLRAAAIFQAGNGTDWNGYRVDYAFPEIGAAAQSPVARTLNRPRMIDTARQPDIQPEPRKVIAQYEVGQ